MPGSTVRGGHCAGVDCKGWSLCQGRLYRRGGHCAGVDCTEGVVIVPGSTVQKGWSLCRGRLYSYFSLIRTVSFLKISCRLLNRLDHRINLKEHGRTHRLSHGLSHGHTDTQTHGLISSPKSCITGNMIFQLY